MISVQGMMERQRVRKQEEETRRLAHRLDSELAHIVGLVKNCTGATLVLTFDGSHSGPVFYGKQDIDKVLYALNALKRQGKTLSEHFADEYAKADKADAAALAKRFDWRAWGEAQIEPVNPKDLRPIKPKDLRPVKPTVSRSTSVFKGRLAKAAVVRSSIDSQWSDGTPRRLVTGFPIDAPSFNGHPVKSGAVVEDYTVAGARFVIDANNHRWELIS